MDQSKLGLLGNDTVDWRRQSTGRPLSAPGRAAGALTLYITSVSLGKCLRLPGVLYEDKPTYSVHLDLVVFDEEVSQQILASLFSALFVTYTNSLV